MRHLVAVPALSLLLIGATALTRVDPYKNYKFRVSVGGSAVAGFSQFNQRNGVPANAVPNNGVANNGAPNNVIGGNNLGGGLANNGTPVNGNAVNGVTGNGVPVQIPGSLAGRSGNVTAICTAVPGSSPNTVTLNCTLPPANGAQGGGLVSGNNAIAGAVTNPNAINPPGRTKYFDVTLERGVTHDPAFESWLSSIRSGKRDFDVDIVNEAGQRSGGYRLTGCTVATFQGMPALDGGAHTVSITALDLHCDGVVTR